MVTRRTVPIFPMKQHLGRRRKKTPEGGFKPGSLGLLSEALPLELLQRPFKSWRFDQNLRRKPNRRDGKRERDGSRSSSSDVNSDFGTDDDYRYGAFHDFHHHVRLYDVTLRLRASQSWQPKTIVGGDVFLAFLRVRPLIFCFLEQETLPSFTLEPNLIKNFKGESLFYSRINLSDWLLIFNDNLDFMIGWFWSRVDTLLYSKKYLLDWRHCFHFPNYFGPQGSRKHLDVDGFEPRYVCVATASWAN